MFTTGPLSHTVLLGVGYQRYDFEEAQGFDAAPSLDIFNPVYGASIPRPPLFLETVTIQEQVGVYGQGQVKAFDRAILTLSGRGDFLFAETKDKLAGSKQKQDDSEFSGRAGLVYLLDMGLAPYASYSKAFLPTLGTDASGKAFEPTIANGYEFGLKYQVPDGKSLLTVSYFNIRQKNVLTPDPVNLFDEIQTGEIRSRGIEFEGNLRLPLGLNLIASYTYQDVEVTESNGADKGNRPITVPKHHASVWGDYTIQSGLLNGLGIGLGVRYKGKSFGDAANTLTVDDFTLVDGSIFYDWKSIRLDLITKNMFNNKHVAACNTASACFFGADRTIVGTVRLRW